MDNIYNTLDENKKQKYVKISIGIFMLFALVIITYFLASNRNSSEEQSSTKDKVGFLDIIGMEDSQSNAEQNQPFDEANIDDPDFGLWSFYNILSDNNVVLYHHIDNGIIFLKRNFIEKQKDKNKYTLYLSFTGSNSSQDIQVDYNDTARSWSASKDFSHIVINGDNKSILYNIKTKQTEGKVEYELENIGEIEKTVSSLILLDNLFFIKDENNKSSLYKIDLKTLKEQKLTNIPIKDITLFNVKNDIYIKNKVYNNNNQLILKYNATNQKLEPYSYNFLEEKIFNNAKLINNNDTNIILNYGLDQKLEINLKTTLNKCGAGEGYVFCGYSYNYKSLNSWLKKENLIQDKIFIQDLETQNIYTIDISDDIKMNIDINDISIHENIIYFTDRNTGAFVGINLDIIKYLELNN